MARSLHLEILVKAVLLGSRARLNRRIAELEFRCGGRLARRLVCWWGDAGKWTDSPNSLWRGHTVAACRWSDGPASCGE